LLSLTEKPHRYLRGSAAAFHQTSADWRKKRLCILYQQEQSVIKGRRCAYLVSMRHVVRVGVHHVPRQHGEGSPAQRAPHPLGPVVLVLSLYAKENILAFKYLCRKQGYGAQESYGPSPEWVIHREKRKSSLEGMTYICASQGDVIGERIRNPTASKARIGNPDPDPNTFKGWPIPYLFEITKG
jgi:hypothetical protein